MMELHAPASLALDVYTIHLRLHVGQGLQRSWASLHRAQHRDQQAMHVLHIRCSNQDTMLLRTEWLNTTQIRLQ